MSKSDMNAYIQETMKPRRITMPPQWKIHSDVRPYVYNIQLKRELFSDGPTDMKNNHQQNEVREN